MTGLKLIGCSLAALVVVASHASHAQEWPNRPVKVIVPFAAAGTTDRMGRLIAEELSKAFKQQFYVENRAGGGGVTKRTGRQLGILPHSYLISLQACAPKSGPQYEST